MNRKEKQTDSSPTKKQLTLIENKIRILEQTRFYNVDTSAQYYLVYLIELNTLAIFKGDHYKKKKIELPFIIMRIKDFSNVNIRIPQKLNDMSMEFTSDNKEILLRFQDEAVKNEIGNKIKNLKKKPDSLNNGEEANYTDIELKYKIAKILESLNFESFKEKYDYRYYLSLNYLSKFSQIYDTKADSYKYLYNRVFMGRTAVVNKKSNINRKEVHCPEH